MWRSPRRVLAVLLALFALSSAASAQVMGIAAVVDDSVVSAYDLESRINLVIVSANLPRTEDSRARIRPQVLRTLVDEELQKNAAREAGVRVPNGEIDNEIENIAQRNGMSGERLKDQLRRAGVDPESLRQQVLAGIAWQRFLATRLLRTVNVSDDEIDELLRQREEARGETVYLVNEILLPVDNPADEAAVRDGAARLVAQIRNGARFDALARQFSSGATAQLGGDVGWVRANQLGPEASAALTSLRSGDVSDPVRTPNGYVILGARDTRIEGQQDIGQIEVTLSQLLIPLGRQAPEEDAERAAVAANSMRDLISSCEDVLPLGEKLSTVSAAELGKLKIGDLPAAFRQSIAELQVDEVSQPVRTAAGIHLLVVCERSAPAEIQIDRNQIRNELINRKLNQRALSYLRTLRRDSIVDYR